MDSLRKGIQSLKGLTSRLMLIEGKVQDHDVVGSSPEPPVVCKDPIEFKSSACKIPSCFQSGSDSTCSHEHLEITEIRIA